MLLLEVPTIYNKTIMLLFIITILTLLIRPLRFALMLHQILKSNHDVDLTVNFKKGEMSVKKKNQG
jgi:hypothetical protein